MEKKSFLCSFFSPKYFFIFSFEKTLKKIIYLNNIFYFFAIFARFFVMFLTFEPNFSLNLTT